MTNLVTRTARYSDATGHVGIITGVDSTGQAYIIGTSGEYGDTIREKPLPHIIVEPALVDGPKVYRRWVGAAAHGSDLGISPGFAGP